MVRQIMSRSQRRMEKKQALTIWILALAVSLVSFALGVLVGRHTTGAPETVVQEVILPEPPPMHPITPRDDKGPSSPTEGETTSPLTFYESLQKGEPAPLGSGINLPPEGEVDSGPKASPEKAKAPSAVPEKRPAPSDPHVLQAASFASIEDARKLAGRLGGMGFVCTVETADLGSKGVWHRVLVGPYPSKESADSAASLLKAEARIAALVRKR